MVRGVIRITHHAWLLALFLYITACVCSCGATSETVAFLVRRDPLNPYNYPAALGPYTHNMVFKFNNLVTNIGRSFDLATSKFTCRVPGVYVFSFSFMAAYGTTMRIQLMHNGKEILYKVGHKPHGAASGEAVLNLHEEDQVWINQVKGFTADAWHQSFTGHLLSK